LSKTRGHVFEAAVIDALRTRESCDVFTNERLDLDHKIDGEIRRRKGKRFPMVVQMQITFRRRHFAKLRDYLSTRWLNRDIVSLYVEIASGSSPLGIAEHIAWAAERTQKMEPYGQLPIFGLSAGDDAVFFDPYARLKELQREVYSPRRTRALLPGTAYQFGDNGFRVRDASDREYMAQYIDVFDHGFRYKLRRSSDKDVPVLFFPEGHVQATDVRQIRPG